MTRIIIFFVLLAGVAFGQPPRGFYAWWDSPVAKDLNLTDSQMQNIRSIVREHRNRLVDERAAIQKAENDIEDLFNDEKFDPHKANEAVERLAVARAEVTRTISQMSVKLRNVITAEQWRELQKRRPAAAGAPLRPGALRNR